MAQCQKCSFVWNSAFSDSLICYDENYNNDVSQSAYYQQHLNARADAVLAAIPADKPIHYVEIGCGDASFIKLVIERAKGRVASAVGFDPSFSANDTLPENVVIHQEMFTEDSLDKIPAEANIICSRHTIEHISAPRSFIAPLAQTVRQSDRVLLLETPNVDWIFQNTAFFDFFFEHCSLFNAASMKTMMADFGLSGSVGLVYGDQYLWGVFRSGDEGTFKGSPEDVAISCKLAAQFQAETAKSEAHWTTALSTRDREGRIGIWGMASKGVTFALVMQQAGHQVDFGIDLNPQKQGCFAPLTGLEIQAPQDVGLTDQDTVIVMNPNYAEEIRATIAQMGAKPRIITL